MHWCVVITPAIYQESIVLDKHGQYQARRIDSLSQESITALCTGKLRHVCVNHAMEISHEIICNMHAKNTTTTRLIFYAIIMIIMLQS